jgi:hypothetical protein
MPITHHYQSVIHGTENVCGMEAVKLDVHCQRLHWCIQHDKVVVESLSLSCSSLPKPINQSWSGKPPSRRPTPSCPSHRLRSPALLEMNYRAPSASCLLRCESVVQSSYMCFARARYLDDQIPSTAIRTTTLAARAPLLTKLEHPSR